MCAFSYVLNSFAKKLIIITNKYCYRKLYKGDPVDSVTLSQAEVITTKKNKIKAERGRVTIAVSWTGALGPIVVGGLNRLS